LIVRLKTNQLVGPAAAIDSGIISGFQGAEIVALGPESNFGGPYFVPRAEFAGDAVDVNVPATTVVAEVFVPASNGFGATIDGEVNRSATVFVFGQRVEVCLHFFSPMCAGQVTVEAIIQISKPFATPFSGFFAKLGKSPKKGRIRVGLNRNGPIRVCVLAQMVYT
jgi:hypothetical protein